MSIQTNFRAQDMLGASKPAAKKPAPAPKPQVVEPEPVATVSEPEVVSAPAPVFESNTDED